MKHFRVKTGFGKDEFISISETELPMAMRAQINGGIGVFEEGTVSGNHIISITPDFNRLMRFNREYALTGEDYAEIGTKRQEEYKEFMHNAKLALEGKAPIKLKNDVKSLAEGMRIKE